MGQNLYWTSASKAATFTRAIDLWYAEVARMNSSWVSSYRSDMNTGHYTQLVWARTNRIGCARRAYGAPSYRYSRAARPELVLSPSSSPSFVREKKQQATNPGYFGGAQYDPTGAQGAITVRREFSLFFTTVRYIYVCISLWGRQYWTQDSVWERFLWGPRVWGCKPTSLFGFASGGKRKFEKNKIFKHNV